MEQILQEGLQSLGLPTEAIPSLSEYTGKLLEKNKVMNLTAITEPEQVATRHLLDCAALLSHIPLREKAVIDVGTGAGFPGIVLRILEPDFDLTLLDSLGKRVSWLETVCTEMQLQRVRCVNARAEEFAADHREIFDVATSRAVAQLNVLCELALPLVKVGGVFVAMKAQESDEEIAAAKHAIGQLGGRLQEVWEYTIPGTDLTHRLVIIKKTYPTPQQFPRAFARIKKQPL